MYSTSDYLCPQISVTMSFHGQQTLENPMDFYKNQDARGQFSTGMLFIHTSQICMK